MTSGLDLLKTRPLSAIFPSPLAMNNTIAFFLTVAACSTLGFAGEQPVRKLAFIKENAIWISNIDGTAPKKIAGGQSPELSPDGTRLAYNTVQDIGQPAHRQIAIADLATGQTSILKDIPSNNCMEPRWSPDGKRLLFDCYIDNERLTGIVNADGTGFQRMPESGPTHQNYWAATWAADGQSYFVEDMQYLYRLGLDGKILNKWAVEKIVARGSMDGDVRLDASPDGRTLLMDVDMDEGGRKGWDGPLPSIWTLDLTTGKSTRRTPKTLYAWDGHWLDAPNSIVFISQGPNEKNTSIYRMTADGQGKDRKLLIKNARMPSTSR